MRFSGRPYGNLDVLPESGEKLQETLHRERPELAPHEAGDVWLLDAKDFPSFGLGKATLADQAVNL